MLVKKKIRYSESEYRENIFFQMLCIIVSFICLLFQWGAIYFNDEKAMSTFTVIGCMGIIGYFICETKESIKRKLHGLHNEVGSMSEFVFDLKQEMKKLIDKNDAKPM